MIKYKLKFKQGTVVDEIVPVEIDKETEWTVWKDGIEFKKLELNASEIFCDTWDEAKNVLVLCAKAKIDSAKGRLIVAELHLDYVNKISKDSHDLT